MIAPADLLTNAERLISDADLLFKHGRVRSAATLVVVALEQMGAFVEVSTTAEFPDAVVQMDILAQGRKQTCKTAGSTCTGTAGIDPPDERDCLVR